MDNDYLTTIHESFWSIQQEKLLKVWNNFNESNYIANGRWEIAIAAMKATETKGTYYFLKERIKKLPDNPQKYKDRNFQTRLVEQCGRYFDGKTLQEIASESNFELKESYSHSEIITFYNDLTNIPFPHESFSKPFSENKKVNTRDRIFSKYLNYSAESKKLSDAYIKEQIIFPFDYAATYQVPSFQPEAVILFMTRVREPKDYLLDPTKCLSIYEKELLRGNQGIDALFSKFVNSDDFRIWERSLNSELSVLKFRMFFESMRANKDRNNWKEVISLALPNIIRGEIKLGGSISEGDSSKQITKLNILENTISIDHRHEWNEISENLRPVFDQYMQLIPSVSSTVSELADSISKRTQAEDRADHLERFKEMLANLQEPLNSLTDAVAQTQRDSQDLRNILYPIDKSLFSVAPLTKKYFDDGGRKYFCGIEWESFHNATHIKKQEEYFALACSVSAIILILLGKGESKKISSNEQLITLVKSSLRQERESPSKIGRLILDILSMESSENVFFSEISECINSPMVFVNNDRQPNILKNAFLILKSIIFTPFKIDFKTETPLSALATIFYSENRNIQLLDNISAIKALTLSRKATKNVFDLFRLPCTRYCDLIALLSGVVSWALNQENCKVANANNVVIKTDSRVEITLKFESNIFQMNKIPDLFELMQMVVQEKIKYPHGNFRKPFLDFALSLRNKLDSLRLVRSDGQQNLIIEDEEYSYVLRFNTDSFSFIVKKEVK